MKQAFRIAMVAAVAAGSTILSFPVRAELKASQEHGQFSGTAEFTKQLTKRAWSWEHNPPFTPHPITFAADGTVRQLNGWTAKWAITGEREVTVTLSGKKAVLHFNKAVTKYKGTDFDGKRQVWGEVSADDAVQT